MFMRHFGMNNSPFERDIASDALYESRQFSEALARLQYACHRRTMAVITGEVGAGKSTLLRMLSDKIDANRFNPLILESIPLILLITQNFKKTTKIFNDYLISSG